MLSAAEVRLVAKSNAFGRRTFARLKLRRVPGSLKRFLNYSLGIMVTVK